MRKKIDGEPKFKVIPGKKKDKEEDKKSSQKIKEQANMLILKHPEVVYSVRDIFNNENRKTIIEEKVPRSDPGIESIMPRNFQDMTNDDLMGIIKYAKGLIDQVINEYDKRVACEDALTRAIATKDDGKYAGKIGASAYNLMLNEMLK